MTAAAARYAWTRFLAWMQDTQPRVPELVPVGLLCAGIRPNDGDDVELDLRHVRIIWPEDIRPEDRTPFLEAIAWAYRARRQAKKPRA